MSHNIKHLLKTERFAPLFITQFLGAMNDNLFKNAMAILVLFRLVQDQALAAQYVTMAGGVFILPFLLFSSLAGQISDKYEKSIQIKWIKLAEIGIMIFAAIAFWVGRVELLFVVLFLMGTQSAFFGPIKYGILPVHLKEEELIGGNGLIEAGTFLAILIGTIVGGVLVLQDNGILYVSLLLLAFAIIGFLSSQFIPKAPAVDPGLHIDKNLFASTWKITKNSMSTYEMFMIILAVSWFWLIGATLLSQFPALGKNVLHSSEEVVTLFLALFSIGIGIGSMLCNKLLAGKVSARLVPWGALGISLFIIDLYFSTTAFNQSYALLGESKKALSIGSFLGYGLLAWRIVADLLLIAMSSGLFIVPLYALMQDHADPSRVSRVIAANNIVNALFMVAGAGIVAVAQGQGASVPFILLVIGLVNVLVVVASFWLVSSYYRENGER